MAPLFSIVIVSLNGEAVLPQVLASLQRLDYPRYEIIVVDNGSTDGTARCVRACCPEAHLICSPVNLGFAGGNNLGMRAARGDFVVLLNDDTEVAPDALAAWRRAFESHPKCGIAGAKLLYPDGRTIQHAGGYVEPNGATHHAGYGEADDGRFNELKTFDYVTGAALAFRREALSEIGPLDEGYYPIYFEEVDACRRAARLGWEVLYVPDCRIVHHESRTQRAFSFRFLFRYTCGRLRFVLKNFSRRELLRAAKREARWCLCRESWPCLLAAFCAYVATVARLPGILRARGKAN